MEDSEEIPGPARPPKEERPYETIEEREEMNQKEVFLKKIVKESMKNQLKILKKLRKIKKVYF